MPIYTPIDQADFLAAIGTLRDAIAADAAWRPAYVVGIGRGGLVPAVYLSHATGVPMLSIDTSAGLADFADALIVKLAQRTQAGERLLFVDDINDTGRTIAQLRAALAAAGAEAAAVRFATLIDNSRSGERVEYAARVIDRTVTKDWFVFPWEAVASAAAIAQDAAEVPERTA